MRGLAVVGLSMLLSSCSSLRLDEDLAPRMCTAAIDCAHLEATVPTDVCTSWQCEGGYCAIGPTDDDADGYVAASCTGAEADDCDDTIAEIHPGAAERSNGADDDCDDIVDEVYVGAERELTRLSSTGRLWTRGQARSEAGDAASVIAVELSDEDASGEAMFVRLSALERPLSVARRLGTSELALRVRDIDSAPLSTSRAIVAAIPDGECGRVTLGTLQVVITPSIHAAVRFMDDTGVHFTGGLEDDLGRTCDSDEGLRARTPVIASSRETIAVAWVAESGAADGCGATTRAPLLVRAGRYGTGDVLAVDATTLRIGETTDASAPALVRSPDGGFLLGYIDGAELVLVRLEQTSTLDVQEIYRGRIGDEGAVGQLRLASGRSALGEQHFAVTAQLGACGEREPRLFRFAIADEGTTARRLDDAGIVVGTGGSTPASAMVADVAFSASPLGYWVVWSSEEGDIRIRGIGEDGSVFWREPVALRFAAGGGFTSLTSLSLLSPSIVGSPSFSLVGVGATEVGASVVVELTIAAP